jgi:hypothetical protein
MTSIPCGRCAVCAFIAQQLIETLARRGVVASLIEPNPAHDGGRPLEDVSRYTMSLREAGGHRVGFVARSVGSCSLACWPGCRCAPVPSRCSGNASPRWTAAASRFLLNPETVDPEAAIPGGPQSPPCRRRPASGRAHRRRPALDRTQSVPRVVLGGRGPGASRQPLSRTPHGVRTGRTPENRTTPPAAAPRQHLSSPPHDPAHPPRRRPPRRLRPRALPALARRSRPRPSIGRRGSDPRDRPRGGLPSFRGQPPQQFSSHTS